MEVIEIHDLHAVRLGCMQFQHSSFPLTNPLHSLSVPALAFSLARGAQVDTSMRVRSLLSRAVWMAPVLACFLAACDSASPIDLGSRDAGSQGPVNPPQDSGTTLPGDDAGSGSGSDGGSETDGGSSTTTAAPAVASTPAKSETPSST